VTRPARDRTASAVDRRLLERVLILAPTGGDALLTAELLRTNGIAATPVQDIEQLCREIVRGTGAVILTTEALVPASVERLAETLREQPTWSELPILVFTGPGWHRSDQSGTFDKLGERAHLTLVDRPIHVRSLVSVTQSALQTRRRQYEICDLLDHLEGAVRRERRHAERLSGLADASLAIASAGSLHDVLKMITEQARQLLSSDIAVTRVVPDVSVEESIRVLTVSDRLAPLGLGQEDEHPTQTDVLGSVVEPLRTRPQDAPDPSLIGKLFGFGSRSELCIGGLLAAPLVEQDGRNLGFIAVCSKTSGYYTEEDEAVIVQLAQMASAVVQNARLYREAQQANRAKDDFLATLAHELRTPMTSILGWVQMLKGNAEQSDIDTAISMIESSTQVQATLVEDLMDVSRIIAGKLTINPSPTELGPVVRNVLVTFRNAAAEAGIEIVPDLDETPLSIWADGTRIQQIIWNLLSNAIKFTPRGGTIKVCLRQVNGSVALAIRDSGEGIEPDFLPYVFERFRQAESGTRRSHGGLGLGLAIVRHLVELHGGTIEARSDGRGKGAEFEIRFPLSAVRATAGFDPATTTDTLRGRKFLIVDDDVSARVLLEEVLGELGVEVRSASSVSAAVQTLHSFPADLIISDIAMPGEDGYALIGRLKELHGRLGREIPTVALTGYGRPEDRLRALGCGFRQYVQKPVEIQTLARLAADLVRSA